MRVRTVETDADLERVSDVLLQLRTGLDRAELLSHIRAMLPEGYQLAYVEQDGDVLCVAGFVITLKLAWGKHLYVDDLVTDERYRSRGAGTSMIKWLKSYAKEHGCEQIHLDSGVQRFAAHRFYLRNGFDISSHHFSITDLAR